MNSPPTNPPVLNYAVPRILFQGEHQWRGRRSGMTIAVLAIMSLAFWSFSSISSGTGWVGRIGYISFTLAALFLTYCLAYVSWRCIAGHRDRAEINEDGIIDGRRFIPWNRIRKFGGEVHSGGITPLYVARGRFAPRPLAVTPSLTADQFRELAQAVRQSVAERFPQVEVDMEPVKPG